MNETDDLINIETKQQRCIKLVRTGDELADVAVECIRSTFEAGLVDGYDFVD